MLGVSTDPVDTHERWIAAAPAEGGLGGLNFPLAADEDGAACRAYGVYLERQRVALRGLFLIDPNGVLQYRLFTALPWGGTPRRSSACSKDSRWAVCARRSGGAASRPWMPARSWGPTG